MANAFIHECAVVKNLEPEHGNNLPVYWLWLRKKGRINPINQFHYQLAYSQWHKDLLALAKAMPIFASRFPIFWTRLHTHNFTQFLQNAVRYGTRALSNFIYLTFHSPSLYLFVWLIDYNHNIAHWLWMCDLRTKFANDRIQVKDDRVCAAAHSETSGPFLAQLREKCLILEWTTMMRQDV